MFVYHVFNMLVFHFVFLVLTILKAGSLFYNIRPSIYTSLIVKSCSICSRNRL